MASASASALLEENEELALAYIALQKGHVRVLKGLSKDMLVKLAASLIPCNLPAAAKVASALKAVEVIEAEVEAIEAEAEAAGSPPLCTAADEGATPEVLKRMLATPGIDVNEAGGDGWTPLPIAAEVGHAAVAAALCDARGVDVNRAMSDGTTPLYMAVQNGHADVAAALCAAPGIDVNLAWEHNGVSPLFKAAQSGHADVLELLCAAGADVNQASGSGTTPLVTAACHGQAAAIEVLIAAGADLNLAPEGGTTPLMAACESRSTTAGLAILAAGPDLEARDAKGRTATNFFNAAGTVTSVRWLNDRETQEFKGVGFVTFSSTEEVDKAVELAGESIDGRQIRIDYAGQKKEGNGGGNTWQTTW